MELQVKWSDLSYLLTSGESMLLQGKKKKKASGVLPAAYLFAESQHFSSIFISISNHLNTIEQILNSVEENLFYNEWHHFIISFVHHSILFLVLFIFNILSPLGIHRQETQRQEIIVPHEVLHSN